MNTVLDGILWFLDLIYGERWVAPFIILPAMLGIAAVVRHRAIAATQPYLEAANARIEALRDALGNDSDPTKERESFAENYISLSAVMNNDDVGSRSLTLAWREFQESMVDESATPIRNTNRPGTFFSRAAPKLTMLTFASNIFVGAGLILTFLGLIVALNTAAQGMAGSDVTVAKQSLQELLIVAGAKFFTSVAGLGASIWLRFSEHGLSLKVRNATDNLCELLERGLLYVSPQRLAVEQLDVLKEQRDQLKFFNTDVALQLSERIGAQFTQAIAPVTASLSALNDNMTAVTQGIGAGAREAIEKISGDELRGLSDTLGDLRTRLDAIGQAVGSSSDDAARQIRLAGEDFANAASDIRDAFEVLTARVDDIGQGMSERGEAANIAQKEALESILGSIEDAQTKSVAMVTDILEALKNGSVGVAAKMRDEVEEVIRAGVEAGHESFRTAIEESGEALKETTNNLSKAVGEAAQQVEKAASGLAKTGQNAERTAEAIKSVTDNARVVATSLGDAAEGFAQAASPVADAARSVNQAANQLAQTITADRAASGEALSEMRALAENVRMTQNAAEQAWRDYRARFEGVDKAMADATDKLAQTLADSMTEFREFAQNVDREMAAAVSRLSNTMTQIEEYAESLDEYVEEARNAREAAE